MNATATSATSRRVDGAAVVSAVLAAGAVVFAGQGTLLPVALAALALTSALVARRHLRADDLLRGTAISLAAFLVSAAVLLAHLAPLVISMIVVAWPVGS